MPAASTLAHNLISQIRANTAEHNNQESGTESTKRVYARSNSTRVEIKKTHVSGGEAKCKTEWQGRIALSLYSLHGHPRDHVTASLEQEGDTVGEAVDVHALLDLIGDERERSSERHKGKRFIAQVHVPRRCNVLSRLSAMEIISQTCKLRSPFVPHF